MTCGWVLENKKGGLRFRAVLDKSDASRLVLNPF